MKIPKNQTTPPQNPAGNSHHFSQTNPSQKDNLKVTKLAKNVFGQSSSKQISG